MKPITIKEIAKANLHAIDRSKHGTLCGMLAENKGDGQVFTATNGHVLVSIRTNAPMVELPKSTKAVGYSAERVDGPGTSQLELLAKVGAIASKPDPFFAGSYPDFRQILPTGKGEPLTGVGIAPKYVNLIGQVSKALRLDMGAAWELEFNGLYGPIAAKPTKLPPELKDVLVLIMPMRLD